MDVVEPFAIDIDERDDRIVVTPRGELDMASAPELEQAVMPRLETGGWVVLDLRALDFIDSSGLRVVVGAHRAAEERGGRFTCVRGAPGLDRAPHRRDRRHRRRHRDGRRSRAAAGPLTRAR